jgi:hypothetical protein
MHASYKVHDPSSTIAQLLFCRPAYVGCILGRQWRPTVSSSPRLEIWISAWQITSFVTGQVRLSQIVNTSASFYFSYS